MSIIVCDRCTRYIDLDFDSEVILVGDVEVCWNCLTDEEQEKYADE